MVAYLCQILVTGVLPASRVVYIHTCRPSPTHSKIVCASRLNVKRPLSWIALLDAVLLAVKSIQTHTVARQAFFIEPFIARVHCGSFCVYIHGWLKIETRAGKPHHHSFPQCKNISRIRAHTRETLPIPSFIPQILIPFPHWFPEVV